MKLPSNKDIARGILHKYQIQASLQSVQVLADMLVPLRIHYHVMMQEAMSTVTNLYYIYSGLLKISHTNEVNNKELVDGFVYKDEFLVSSDLFTNKPAVQNVKTIEPTVCFALPYLALKHRASTNADLNELLCAILEESTLNQQAYNDLISLSLKDRVVEMSKNKPIIMSRCPMKDIANYLRMRSETLSRIRTSLN